MTACLSSHKQMPKLSVTTFIILPMVNGQWFIVSYDSGNKQKYHKSHRMQ